jgi:hypothetical protein
MINKNKIAKSFYLFAACFFFLEQAEKVTFWNIIAEKTLNYLWLRCFNSKYEIKIK